MRYFRLYVRLIFRQAEAEQRIKSVLNVKQHKRVNDNSLNKLFLLNMFKRIELLPPTRDRYVC